MAPVPGRERASAAVWRWRPGEGTGSAAGGVRRRGLLRGALALGVAALLALWKPMLGAVAAALAVAFLAVALTSPRGLQPRVERVLAAFARALAAAVSWATLTLVHLLVFLPLGLALRATGKLRLVRHLDPEAPSYWRPADRARPDARSHERQF